MKIETLRDVLFWTYANTAMAHYALSSGVIAYNRVAFAIRARLYKGLSSGVMNVSSLYDDERERLKSSRECVYCKSSGALSLDHLIPRSLGGSDSGDNLVYACRSCNSSKKDRDLLLWYSERGTFPPLFVLRRYLKLSLAYAEEKGLMNTDFHKLGDVVSPFRYDLFPLEYPNPKALRF